MAVMYCIYRPKPIDIKHIKPRYDAKILQDHSRSLQFKTFSDADSQSSITTICSNSDQLLLGPVDNS